MKAKFFVCMGGAAALTAIVALLGQSDVVAQDATDDTAVQNEQFRQTRPAGDRNVDARTRTPRQSRMHAKSHKASELIGMNVRGSTGDEEVGSINDLMVSENGRVVYAAVSFGGFLGLGDKLFAVPFNAIEFVKTDDGSYARIDVSEEKMKDMEGFDQENWPTEPNRRFASRPNRSLDRGGENVNVDIER